MKLVKKVKIASRSFYLSQSIYILRGSHTVENSKHDIDDAGMRCSSGTYKVQVVRSSGTYSVSKGVLGRMGPMGNKIAHICTSGLNIGIFELYNAWFWFEYC